MVTPRQTGRPLGGEGRDERERSLCRERFRDQNFTIGYHHRLNCNQTPRDTQMAYAPVWCPNT
jgi:hypothetical protein